VKTVRFLFNDAMARAIVEGRKTVTRRPVDFRKLPHGVIEERDRFGLWPFWEDEAGDWHPETRCAAPGDLLIGRECWRVFGGVSDVRVGYRAGGASSIIHRAHERVGGVLVHYLPDVSKMERSDGKWRPSIHMPDWAARIRRRVVSVTVERLQDISEADAVREGFEAVPVHGEWVIGGRETHWSARKPFADTWDAIYAAKGIGWAVNPWVWRIEFAGENERGPTP
jgi:hypothetical protein